jgi:uncharacterized coiled-coil protein SlyX
MSTQEERLTALEQAQVGFGEAVGDLNHHVTMLIGIAQRQEWDIREMKSSLRFIDSRLGSLEGRFDAQDKKLDQILLSLNTLIPKPGQET